MEKIVRVEIRLIGEEKEIERIKARVAILSVSDAVVSMHIKEV